MQRVFQDGDKVRVLKDHTLSDGTIIQERTKGLIKNYSVVIDEYMIGDDVWIPGSKLELLEAAKTNPKANRYNEGKPQFSYILDWPNALDILVQYFSDVPEIPKDPLTPMSPVVTYGGIFEAISVFQREESLNPIIWSINKLLRDLQHAVSVNKKGYCEEIMVHNYAVLIAGYGDAWAEVARVCSNGAFKYARNNWQKGLPYLSVIDSFARHYLAYTRGEARDQLDKNMKDRWENETGFKDIWGGDFDKFKKQFETHHLAHCIWNLMVILEYSVIKPEMDNRVIA